MKSYKQPVLSALKDANLDPKQIDEVVLGWLKPKDGNLVDRLVGMDDAAQLAEELYLAVLTRRPSAEEVDVLVRAIHRVLELFA